MKVSMYKRMWIQIATLRLRNTVFRRGKEKLVEGIFKTALFMRFHHVTVQRKHRNNTSKNTETLHQRTLACPQWDKVFPSSSLKHRTECQLLRTLWHVFSSFLSGKSADDFSLASISEAESFLRSSASQISRILWNLKVYYRVHKSPQLVPILRQMNPIHPPKPYFTKIHFNIIRIYSLNNKI
jgi:Rps23 Pro-64 3,4-dihydroxylase Tpa1-like proline 4-hydroxylase